MADWLAQEAPPLTRAKAPDTDRLSILYVTLQARRPGEAGHTHVTEIIRGLKGLGHSVTLLEPKYPSLSPSILRRLWTLFRVIRQAQKHIGRHEGDVVYIRGHPLTYPVSARARRAGVPVVLERNAPLSEIYLIRRWLRPLHMLFRWLVRREIRAATVVIGVTPAILEESRQLGAPADIEGRVMPNGANVDVMHPVPNPDLTQYGLEPGRYVVFVGAMARWQGIPWLLDAVRSREWPEGIQMAFCGHGPLLPDILDLGSTSPVRYLGIVPYEEIAVLVSGALAGLAPVDQPPERAAGSSALKVFEYLSCGRPAIVTDVPGLREIIQDGACGRVVPLNDPDAIAREVRWLHEHREEADSMGRRGRELIVASHSWATRARELEELLLETIRNGS